MDENLTGASLKRYDKERIVFDAHQTYTSSSI
jgi:hypothetical protein